MPELAKRHRSNIDRVNSKGFQSLMAEFLLFELPSTTHGDERTNDAHKSYSRMQISRTWYILETSPEKVGFPPANNHEDTSESVFNFRDRALRPSFAHWQFPSSRMRRKALIANCCCGHSLPVSWLGSDPKAERPERNTIKRKLLMLLDLGVAVGKTCCRSVLDGN
jgi:hypothetical protein